MHDLHSESSTHKTNCTAKIHKANAPGVMLQAYRNIAVTWNRYIKNNQLSHLLELGRYVCEANVELFGRRNLTPVPGIVPHCSAQVWVHSATKHLLLNTHSAFVITTTQWSCKTFFKTMHFFQVLKVVQRKGSGNFSSQSPRQMHGCPYYYY